MDWVDAADTTPLIGIRLLDGYRLCAGVRDGVNVTIARLP